MFLMKFFVLILPVVFGKNLTEVPKSITSICIETGLLTNFTTFINRHLFVTRRRLAGWNGL